MHPNSWVTLAGRTLPLGLALCGQAIAEPVKETGVVTITASGPSSLPSRVPATMESLSARQIDAQINASDSEDALKYLPSLQVRKRYIGDYNHAILSSRASGTGNSARSAVYADGMLLSNFLGNGVGGLSFPPRWGMVTPEEIERVDVMYGPLSAAYPGNSVGAVVDYTTRMPERFEGSVKVGAQQQAFDLYNTQARYGGWQSSAALGNRSGDWSWRLNLQRSDSQSQPLTFGTVLRSSAAARSSDTVVSGAVASPNKFGQDTLILGTGTQYHTLQDHIKLKLAYDLSPVLRASYTWARWDNRAEGRPSTYLRNSAGQPVSSGSVNIGGQAYNLSGATFPLSNERLQHTLQGVSVKSRTQGVFDWELTASVYDYGQDDKRSNAASNPWPGAAAGGMGTLAQGAGSGWRNFAWRGTWRPEGPRSAHVVDFGLQQDQYTLRYTSTSLAGNWLSDSAGTLASEVGGRTQLHSAYLQDTWRLAARWRAVLGLRAEHWQAQDGLTRFSALSSQRYAQRSEHHTSPKAALAWQASADGWVKYAIGRAVRVPTVNELYGATATTLSQYINDPLLRSEKSWTQELSYESTRDQHQWRLTAFAENTRDSLYAQTVFDTNASRNISRVQNVGRIATRGLEAVYSGTDLGLRGLDVSTSLTFTDSVIRENTGFVSTPGDTLGKRQPNIPRWRATLLAGYRWSTAWYSSVAVRHSSTQFNTLNNSDVNSWVYMGVSPFTTVDLRTRWQIDPRWSAAFGIDNLTGQTYWNFHPYPQRSYSAELRTRF